MAFTKNGPVAGDVIASAHIRNIEDFIFGLNTVSISGTPTTGVTTFTFGKGLACSGVSADTCRIFATGGIDVMNDVGNVNVASPTAGGMLVYDGPAGEYVEIPSGTLVDTVANLNDIGDVDIASPSNTGLLRYNSTSGNYEEVLEGALAPSTLNNIGNVNIPSPTHGGLIYWKSGAGEYGEITTGALIPAANDITYEAVYSNFYVGLTYEKMFTNSVSITGVYVKTTNAPSGADTVTFKVQKNGVNLQTGIVIDNTGVKDQAISASFVKGDVIKFEITAVDDTTDGDPIFFGIY